MSKARRPGTDETSETIETIETIETSPDRQIELNRVCICAIMPDYMIVLRSSSDTRSTPARCTLVQLMISGP